MPPHSPSAWLALVPLAALASAQNSDRVPASPQSLTSTPTPLATGAPAAARPPRVIPERKIGPAAESAPAHLDDSIPLPIAPIFASGEEGDTVVSEAGGDPFFLSFVAGPKYPAAGELIDPELVRRFQDGFADGRPAPESYAFVMFQKRITPERVEQLESSGLRVLQFHPFYTLKVAGSLEALDAVSTLDFVRWVGAPETWQKLHPALGAELDHATAGERLDVWINVYESDLNEGSTIDYLGHASLVSPTGVQPADPAAPTEGPKRVQSNGWMHAALEAQGVEIRNYVDEVFAFRALVPAERFEQLLALDFVQFVDGYGEAVTAHDESRAMVMSDRVAAQYDGGTNSAAIVGEIDTGFDLAHQDLNIWGVGWDCTASPGGAWADSNGHGSHVASSILGRGVAQADQKGNAPGLASWGGTGRFFTLRMLNGANPCSWTMDAVYDVFENSFFDGVDTTERPMAINCSWGTLTAGSPTGTETQARLIDNQVWLYRQSYVFAAGNEGSGAGTLRIEPSSKNALTVGNVVDYQEPLVGDPGSLWLTSSRGPCGDGRWKPNVVAPGRWIRGVAANTTNGYANFSGTSMAAPHVTGVIAELCDRWSYLRHNPVTVQSLLMATAMPKDDAILSFPSDAHLDEYGAGRANAYKAAYDNAEHAILYNNTLTVGPTSGYQFGDFTVTSDMTRIVVVMHYHEVASSAGAGNALLDDWDLWLDQEPISSTGNSGEFFAHQSSIDNTEIRILDNPLPGQWRWKAYPESVTTVSNMSITVEAIYGDTSPTASLVLGASGQYFQPGEPITIDATVTPDEYIASSVFLDTTGSTYTLLGSSTTLDDGTVTDLLDNPSGGHDVTLGDIFAGDSRTAEWTLRYTTEGIKTYAVAMRSDNSANQLTSLMVTIDGTPPSPPTNLTSTSHTPSVWSNDPTIDFTWTASTDNLAGVAGYSTLLSTGSPSLPSASQTIGAVTSVTVPVGTISPVYFNLRPRDRSDNWSPGFASVGPYRIDTLPPNAPGALHSTTHSIGTPSCESAIEMQWNPGTDNGSGVIGYSWVWSHSTSPLPDMVVDGSGTSFTTNLSESGLGWYFGIRSRDLAGNWSPANVSGPYFIDLGGSSTYCVATANSTGFGAGMDHDGTLSIGANNLTLTCEQLPPNQTCIFFYGASEAQVAFGNGFRCVGGQLFRYSPVSTTSGFAQQPVDYGNPPFPPGQITNGSTWNFQCWYRDPLAGGAFFNLSNGLKLTFCP